MIKFKHLLFAAGVLLAGAEAQAQYLRTSYFMEGTSSRLQMNPGLQPTRGYFNFPVIDSLNVGASSNVLGTSDIIDVLLRMPTEKPSLTDLTLKEKISV